MNSPANPFYAARHRQMVQPRTVQPSAELPVQYARLPRAPRTASPVPHLTSLYHFHRAGEYGDRSYPGNCGGNLIADLLRFYKVRSVIDPMTGSDSCRDVCKELKVYCYSSDLHQGTDACDPASFPKACFEFAWLHRVDAPPKPRPWRRSAAVPSSPHLTPGPRNPAYAPAFSKNRNARK